MAVCAGTTLDTVVFNNIYIVKKTFTKTEKQTNENFKVIIPIIKFINHKYT